jgi:hypothetical protein
METKSDMDSARLATETTRYLNAVDVFRSLGRDVNSRSEADEVGALSPAPRVQRPPGSERRARPLVRINGQYVSFQT